MNAVTEQFAALQQRAAQSNPGAAFPSIKAAVSHLISDAEQRAQERRVSLAKRFCLCSPCSDERQAQPSFHAGYLAQWWA